MHLYDYEIENSALKHGLTRQEIHYALRHQVKSQIRTSDKDRDSVLTVGILPSGKLVEIVGIIIEEVDLILVIHAFTPVTKGFLKQIRRLG